jgi:hypothetical protein
LDETNIIGLVWRETLKILLTPETAIDSFVKLRKTNSEIPVAIYESIRGYKKWNENALKGLINASGYFPEILFEEDMEKNIYVLLSDIKKREVPSKN